MAVLVLPGCVRLGKIWLGLSKGEGKQKKKKKGNEQTIKNFTVGGPLPLYRNLTVVRGLLLGKWGGGGGELREGPSE